MTLFNNIKNMLIKHADTCRSIVHSSITCTSSSSDCQAFSLCKAHDPFQGTKVLDFLS